MTRHRMRARRLARERAALRRALAAGIGTNLPEGSEITDDETWIPRRVWLYRGAPIFPPDVFATPVVT